MGEQAQSSRGGAIGCLVVIAAVAGGVFWFVSSFDNPRRQVAASVHDYSDICEGRPIPGAPAYVPGAGPHPIAVFDVEQDEGETGVSDSRVSFSYEDGAALNPTDPATVELVACTGRVENGPEAGSCAFQDTTAPMHQSTLEITVYEARTAQQVGEPTRVVGEDLSCPSVILHSGSPEVFSSPTVDQYRSVLGSLVAG